MGYIQGEGRNQGTLFPEVLDGFVPADHVCRVIDAFVEMLVMSELGFERAQAAETGRPGYDPRDLLKLYLYGYLNQIRSSRRLEAECRRNVELMWLLGRLYPDIRASLSSVGCTAMQLRQRALNWSALHAVADLSVVSGSPLTAPSFVRCPASTARASGLRYNAIWTA